MEFIKCKGCGNMVSIEAEACPNCGSSMEQVAIEITPGLAEAVRKYDELEEFHEGFATVRKDQKWGFINKNGEEIVPCGRYDKLEEFHEGLAKVATKVGFWLHGYFLNALYGFINENGEEVVPCIYNKIEDFSEGLAKVWKGGLCGFVNENGEEVVPCRYKDAEDFSEGLAKVRKGDLWGFINKNGEEIVPCGRYDKLGGFHEGLAWVQKGDEWDFWGFVNKNGEEVIPCVYDRAEDFSEGFARVKKDGLYGFINKNGEEVVPCIYDRAKPYLEGLAWVQKDGLWGLINKNGKEVLPCRYAYDALFIFVSFSFGVDEITMNSRIISSVVKHENRKGLAELSVKGIFDSLDKFFEDPEINRDLVPRCKISRTFRNKKGKGVVPERHYALSFLEGLAMVCKGDLWGYINKNGEEIVPCGRYDKLEEFHEGLAMVWKANGREYLWGYINKNGEEVVPCGKYDSLIWGFSEGLAAVSIANNWGFINEEGEEVIPCGSYDEVFPFKESLAAARAGDFWGFINKKGEMVIPCRYDAAWPFSEGLAVVVFDGKWGYVDKKGNSTFDYK